MTVVMDMIVIMVMVAVMVKVICFLYGSTMERRIIGSTSVGKKW